MNKNLIKLAYIAGYKKAQDEGFSIFDDYGRPIPGWQQVTDSVDSSNNMTAGIVAPISAYMAARSLGPFHGKAKLDQINNKISHIDKVLARGHKNLLTESGVNFLNKNRVALRRQEGKLINKIRVPMSKRFLKASPYLAALAFTAPLIWKWAVTPSKKNYDLMYNR